MLKRIPSQPVPARMSERQEELDVVTPMNREIQRIDEMDNPTVCSQKATKSMMKSSSENEQNSPKFSLEFSKFKKSYPQN